MTTEINYLSLETANAVRNLKNTNNLSSEEWIDGLLYALAEEFLGADLTDNQKQFFAEAAIAFFARGGNEGK